MNGISRQMEHCEATSHSLIASIGPRMRTDETLVLLHGSGVDETTLVPLAREIAPRAILIAVRGRIAQDGGMRWFTRITPTRFEQQSIRTEAAAFAGFIGALHESSTASICRERHFSAIRTAPISFQASCCSIPA